MIRVYTDGACGNDKVGGWSWLRASPRPSRGWGVIELPLLLTRSPLVLAQEATNPSQMDTKGVMTPSGTPTPMSPERNVRREAHVIGLCLEHDVDWEWIGRGGRAYYAKPSSGAQAVVHLAPIRGQMTYFVALHELGHVLSPRNRYMTKLEAEADAWQWALGEAQEDPTLATLRGIRRRLGSYVAKAIRDERMKLPEDESEFGKFWAWLRRAAV